MWNILSKILNVILFIWTIYLYLENRKLKGFEIGKNIELKEIEIKELEQLYLNKKEELVEELQSTGLLNFDPVFKLLRGKYEVIEELQSKGLFNSQNDLKKVRDLVLEYKNKFDKLNAELSYLNRLKKYKWLFS